MRTILFLLRKEFLQIFRHRIMLPLIFVMPIVQLLVLAFAADYEVRNIALHVIDRDGSTLSQRLVGHFQASKHFNIVRSSFSPLSGAADLEAGEADLFLDIAPHFERDLEKEGRASIQLTIDAINGVKAGLASSYANAIIRNFNREVLAGTTTAAGQGIQVVQANWFNPTQEYHNYMVPGILVVLVTLVGMFLCGMNIVKEKEIGTIEQLNVSPIRKYHFIIGKLLPFWIIGLVELAAGLFFGKLVFDIPINGSLGLVFGFAAVYLPVVLGIGLLISTVTNTQQQAMFIAWFFLIIFILMSGLFTPIESMPAWAQKITKVNPVAYFVEVMRMVLLKGSTAPDIARHFGAMIIYGIVINTLALLNYRKQTA